MIHLSFVSHQHGHCYGELVNTFYNARKIVAHAAQIALDKPDILHQIIDAASVRTHHAGQHVGFASV